MKNLLKKYFISVLSPKEFSELSDHINNKRNESSIFNLIKPFWDNQIKEKDVAPKSNPALLNRIKQSVLLEKQKSAERRIRIYTWSLRAAAVFILGLLVSNLFFLQKSVENQIDQTFQTISTPYGAKTKVVLEDGSSVWLNSGSTITYNINFNKNRRVDLVGEAYFDVEKSSYPFIVSTDYGDVEVKGTSFNVKAFADDNSFESTLVEGVVVFRMKNSLEEYTLKEGEQIGKTENGFTVKEVKTQFYTSWKEGKLMFDKEPFNNFLKKLERWYNVKIEHTDPKLNELWYTGTIEMESVSEVMEMMSKAAPISYSFNKETRVFTITGK